MPQTQSSRIHAALSAYESTIQKNVESGEHCGMYLSNKVGHGGLGTSRHSRGTSSRDESRHREQQHRHSRSPTGKNPNAEARRAAEKLKRRAHNNMHGRSRRQQERPQQDDKIPATLQLDSLTPAHTEKSRNKASDRSARTETTDELTLDDLENPVQGQGWKSFEDSFFSEADASIVAYEDDNEDCFSLLDESSFQEPDFKPELKPKKKKETPADWTSEFAVASNQQRLDESESERVAEIRKERPQRGQRPSRQKANPYQNREDNDSESDRDQGKRERTRKKHNSKENPNPTRRKKKADPFAITYQHRPDESDSDFDPEDMRGRIRKKQLGASSSSLQMSGSKSDLHPPVASFSLSRSNSSRSLNRDGSETEDLDNSFRSHNSKTLKPPPPSGMGDNFRNMVMGGSSNHMSSSFLGGDDLGDANESESERFGVDNSRHRRPREYKPPTRPATHDDGACSDAGAFSASKPKPIRKKYGAAAAAENFSALPPAFQTIYRSQAKEKKGESHTSRHRHSSRQADRKTKSPKKSSEGAFANFDETDDFTPFKTDRSFFDCV